MAKKVDSSLLNATVTPIPKWLWEIEKLFANVNSKKCPSSKVSIHFEKELYKGNVTFSRQSNGRSICRLHCEQNLHSVLKEHFLMTYMRSLEGQIRKSQGGNSDIELEIPFWEFLDIEFDSLNRKFIFTCHYHHQPTFPELFKQLVSSPAIKAVDDMLNDNSAICIYKQNWKLRTEYKNEIGAENVIYTLLDSKNKLIYIGEAKKLIARFDNGHPDISNWGHYKYNVLPESLESNRLTIERMAIRDMASLLANKMNIPNIEISPYRLANRKIDK